MGTPVTQVTYEKPKVTQITYENPSLAKVTQVTYENPSLASMWYLLQDKPWGPETLSGTGTIFMLGENVIQNTYWSMSKVAATHFNTVEVAIQTKY